MANTISSVVQVSAASTISSFASSLPSTPSTISLNQLSTLSPASSELIDHSATLSKRARDYYLACNPDSYLVQCVNFHDLECDSNGRAHSDNQNCIYACWCVRRPVPPPVANCYLRDKYNKLIGNNCFSSSNWNLVHDDLKALDMEKDGKDIEDQNTSSNQLPEPEATPSMTQHADLWTQEGDLSQPLADDPARYGCPDDCNSGGCMGDRLTNTVSAQSTPFPSSRGLYACMFQDSQYIS